MKADLTRNTFNKFLHFDRVLMQQGRVQLDADWNEQSAILLHYLHTLAADLIGPQGGPSANLGFGLAPFPRSNSVIANDFVISSGRYYVDGLLCEAHSLPVAFRVSPNGGSVVTVDEWTLDGLPFQNEQFVEIFDDVRAPKTNPAFDPTVVQITNPDPVGRTFTLQGAPPLGTPAAPMIRRVYSYLNQPDYPVPQTSLLTVGDYLVYLDVWERLITYIEYDEIREVALGGPDTAARAKVVWQVKLVPGKTNPDAKNACDGFDPTNNQGFAELFLMNHGRLKAKAKQSKNSADPCIIPPTSSYSGPENQLYRVEIHRSGSAWDGSANGKSVAATFKWSRENGSVAFPIATLSTGNGTTTVVMETLGHDDRLGLTEGAWVEVQDDSYVLQNRAEPLLQVQSIDVPSLTVTLAGAVISPVGTDSAQHPLLRRWDYQAGDPALGGLQLGSDMGPLILEQSSDAWLSLEDGILIQFQAPDTGRPATAYQTGDYWLIPARTATGDVDWPTEIDKDSQGNAVVVQLPKPPDGIEHHYAPLGVITTSPNGVTVLGDCRKRFGSLAV